MSLRELVVGSTQMLVESVLRRINENLLDYFINLPESIWLSGFLDQVNLKDVMFNTRAFSNEWYSLDIPFRLKYGHIRRANIQVLLAHSKLVMEVEGVVIIVGPNLAYKSYEDVIRNTMDNVSSHVELFKHIQSIKNNKRDINESLNSQKEDTSDSIIGIKSSNKEGLNALLRWLFRYVPDLSLSIRNLYIRYEDDILDVSHPMSAGIHINSLTINPARNCWDFQWPSEDHEDVKFISKNDFGSSEGINNLQHPLRIINSNVDSRGIFSIKIKELTAFLDDESAPFIPVSLLEQTEASNDKYGVFSAVTIDDIQNLVDTNLQYHTRIISNMNISAQFGFINPIIQKSSTEKNFNINNDKLYQKASLSPTSPTLSSSSFSPLNTNNQRINDFIEQDCLNDYSMGSNIATLLNINIQSGFEINVYPQMIHGLVRFVTLYNQFQFWTQVRRFRPIERPGSGNDSKQIREICREWWIFSLKYYRNMKYKDKHNNLKDEINYRIERKKYIKIIKKWKWIEYIITGIRPISDSESVLKGTHNIKNGIDQTIFEKFGKNIDFSIPLVHNFQIEPNVSSIFNLSNNLHLNLCRYWLYDVDLLQKISSKNEDIKCILTVLQHHSYWIISQWHILAEREFEIEFALFQNNQINLKRSSNVYFNSNNILTSDYLNNLDARTKDSLTLLAYGLHIQVESNIWDLINNLRLVYSSHIKDVFDNKKLYNYLLENIPTKNSIFKHGSVLELGLTSGITTNVATNIKDLIQENLERHPYIVFGNNLFKQNKYNILTDFFGVNLENKLLMNKKDWHSIRLRLHLWGRFYDEYFESFPLAISETIETRQLMHLTYYLDFQQMNKLFTISLLNDSLNLSSLISNQCGIVTSKIEDMNISTGTRITMARPKQPIFSTKEEKPSLLKDEVDNINTNIERKSEKDDFFQKNNQINKEFNETNDDDKNKKKFKFEKKLPHIYNDSINIPEWLSDLAGPGINLPKIFSNRIIGICIPKCEVNICHLVKEHNNNNISDFKNNKSSNSSENHMKLFKNGRNINTSTISYIPRKLFGILITSFGFNMNTCTSLRLSCCLKKIEAVVWNYNDSNLMREFISSINSDKIINKKMIKDDQIVILSISDEKSSYINNNNMSQTFKNSNNLSESSPKLIHFVDDINNESSSPLLNKSTSSMKTVRFEDSLYNMNNSTETIRTSNSELNNQTINQVNNTNHKNRYLKKWNYLTLVILPPNNSIKKENLEENNNETYSNFVFKLPFYLKMDINITPIIMVINEQLIDNMRSEIMKLLQVYLLTIWSQYKGLGAFPVTEKISGYMNENIESNLDKTKEKNYFELLLCHPFNLSLNKYNIHDKTNISEWNKINTLLNKVHVRISIKLPSIEIYMLNESMEYFYQNDDIKDNDNISFDLSTSFKLSIEPQTLLIGTLIDKLRGNMNRIYFRGFQMKFDTQQNITSIIKLYLRFKNLFYDRYSNIIAIMNLFKDDKFDYISKHSLTSFTNEILRLQCEKLPDTNNILLKEFTLNINGNVFDEHNDNQDNDNHSHNHNDEHGDNYQDSDYHNHNSSNNNHQHEKTNNNELDHSKNLSEKDCEDQTFQIKEKELQFQEQEIYKDNELNKPIILESNIDDKNINKSNSYDSSIQDNKKIEQNVSINKYRKSSKLISTKDINLINVNKNINYEMNIKKQTNLFLSSEINQRKTLDSSANISEYNLNTRVSNFNNYTPRVQSISEEKKYKKKPAVSLRTGFNVNN